MRQAAREWRKEHGHKYESIPAEMEAYATAELQQQATSLHAAYKIKIDHERSIQAELIKQRDEARARLQQETKKD